MAAILILRFKKSSGARNPHPPIYHCIIKDKTKSAKSRQHSAFWTIKHVRVMYILYVSLILKYTDSKERTIELGRYRQQCVNHYNSHDMPTYFNANIALFYHDAMVD